MINYMPQSITTASHVVLFLSPVEVIWALCNIRYVSVVHFLLNRVPIASFVLNRVADLPFFCLGQVQVCITYTCTNFNVFSII